MKKSLNYIIMQRVHTHINGNRCKRTFIQNIRVYSDHVKPVVSFATIENLIPHVVIPDKGFLTELDCDDFISGTWFQQFVHISYKKTYILYAQVIFSDIPIVYTYKINFIYAADEDEDYYTFFNEIRKRIVLETLMNMVISGLDYKDSLSSRNFNFFYRATLVLENLDNIEGIK